MHECIGELQRVAVRYSVLQCVAVRATFSADPSVSVELPSGACVCIGMLQFKGVRCSVRCSAL